MALVNSEDVNVSAFKKKSETGMYYFTYKHILSHARMIEEQKTMYFNNWDGMMEWMDRYSKLPDTEIIANGPAMWRERDGMLIPDTSHDMVK